MRKFYILLPAILLFIPARAQFQPGMSGSGYCSFKKSQNTGLLKLAAVAESGGPAHQFDVLDYTLNLDIYHCYSAPWPNDFTGSNTMTFLVDSTLHEIRLNALNSSMEITGIGISGVSFTHVNDTLTIQLDRTYNPGETAKVWIGYQHLNVKDHAFNVGYNMVFTDAEPEGARKWFPCWDHPSDKATTDLTVKVPANVKLSGNGALMDSTVNGDTLVYHWQSIHNVATYLTVLTSRVNYNLDVILWPKLSDTSVKVPIRFYYNPGENPGAVENVISDMCTYYSQNFCEHPFQKNGFATVDSLFTWGGMENQTLTTLCRNCWGEHLASHEFAHQWFGDMITCGTWADIWLNEGFATWTESFWKERNGGYSAYKTSIDANAADYLVHNPGWAIVVPSWATSTPHVSVLFNYAVTYAKSACILHQLRYLLGDSVFFQVLKAYSADTNLQFKSAVTRDLNDKFNQVSGSSWDWYFNSWLYQPNHPVYQNYYDIMNPMPGEWKVGFLANQVQTNAPFFPMILELKIIFADSADTTFRIMNSKNYQIWNWTFPKQPVSFKFDPGNQIVLKQATTYLATSSVFPDTVLLNHYINSSDTIYVQASSSWTIQGTMPEWLSADKVSGNENEYVVFHALSDNPDSTKRMAEFTFVPDLGPSIGFSVTQLGTPAGIDEKNPSFLKVFPNPAKDQLTIRFELVRPVSFSIDITDVAGKMIYTPVSEFKPAGLYTLNIDCSGLEPGVYFCRITAGDYNEMKKIVVNK